MPKCPNCGQTAERTEDWACQWCGYPLLSKFYKKLPETFRQLKREKPLESEPEPEPVPVPEPAPAPVTEPEPEPVPVPEPEPVPVPEPALKSAATGITVEDLYSTYSTDEIAADAELTGKIFTVTGVVDRITVNDVHSIYYIILVAAEKKERWNVRCSFDRKYGSQLKQLAVGQTVTVQGKYSGYKTNILVADCALVS